MAQFIPDLKDWDFLRPQVKSATDFRKSLEARLQTLATKTGEDLQRLRRKVAFDRFLARIFSHENQGFFLNPTSVTFILVACQQFVEIKPVDDFSLKLDFS